MGHIDYETINAQALAAYPELLKRWFPAGRVAGREFMGGNLQGAPGDSLKINIDTGIGPDFATDETFGDPISLNALRLNCHASEAALDLAETRSAPGLLADPRARTRAVLDAPYPMPVSDASAAAIIRGIERDHPTLLLDEAQHFLKRRPG